MSGQASKTMKEKYRPINHISTSLLHALYSVSKNILATSSTIVGPTALELPRPNTTSARRTGWARANNKNPPYNATIVPLPSGASFASATDALRSEINVSTTCNVNRVHAMCTAAGPLNAFKCHPFFDIRSPTSYTFTDASRAPNATTEAGGEPRTYNSGMDEVIVLAMWRAQVTMSRQD